MGKPDEDSGQSARPPNSSDQDATGNEEAERVPVYSRLPPSSGVPGPSADYFLLASLFGGFVGSIGMPVIEYLLDILVGSPNLNDGQYVLSFFFTMPLGGLTGVVVGSASVSAWTGDRRAAATKCLVAGIGELVLIFALIPRWDVHYVPWVAAAYAGAGLLTLAGLALLGSTRPPSDAT